MDWSNFDEAYKASNSTIPVWIVMAADDSTSNPQDAIAIAQAKPNVEITLITNGGHLAPPNKFFVNTELGHPLSELENNKAYNESVYDWLAK